MKQIELRVLTLVLILCTLFSSLSCEKKEPENHQNPQHTDTEQPPEQQPTEDDSPPTLETDPSLPEDEFDNEPADDYTKRY